MVTFSDSAKKGVHRGFIAHGGEIKGPAAEEASKKAETMEGTTVKKQAWNNKVFLTNFGSLLGAFWEPKGFRKSNKILDVILEAKRGPGMHPLRSAWRNVQGPWGE